MYSFICGLMSLHLLLNCGTPPPLEVRQFFCDPSCAEFVADYHGDREVRQKKLKNLVVLYIPFYIIHWLPSFNLTLFTLKWKCLQYLENQINGNAVYFPFKTEFFFTGFDFFFLEETVHANWFKWFVFILF